MLHRCRQLIQTLPTLPWPTALPQQPQYWLALFCLSHLVIWVGVLLLIRHNPPFDAIEAVAWGQLWQLGYDKHPPLAPWLIAAGTRLFGSIDLSIYLLSQLCIVGSFIAIWKIGCRLFSPLAALVAVFLLEGILYNNILTSSVDPDTLMLPLWGASLWFFYQAVSEQQWRSWALLGLMAGLAMLAKYESAILLLVLFSLLLFTPEGRKSFIKPGFYLACAVFSAVILPHIYWLFKHNFLPIHYLFGRTELGHSQLLNHVVYPTKFLFEQLGMIAPLLLLALPFYCSQHEPTILSRFAKTYLLAAGLGPLILIITFSFITGAQLMAGWGYPLFLFSGLLLIAWLKPQITLQQFKQFCTLLIGLSLMMVILKVSFVSFAPYFTGRAGSAYFPGKNIAATFTAAWHSAYQQPLPFVAGDRALVAHIAVYSADRPTPYFNWNTYANPWVDEQKMKNQGALFVWIVQEKQATQLPEEIAQRFPQAITQPIIVFPVASNSKVPPLQIASAYLPPANKTAKLEW